MCVHREATERVGANRLGRNGMRGRVYREGLDGTGDGNEAWRTSKRRKRTSYGRNAGPVDREGCGVPQNGGNRLVLERYSRNGGPVHRRGVAYRKTGLHGILFISTVDLLQPPRATVDLLQPPPATVHPRAPVHPALHRLLFIQPSTGWSYSSSPPRVPVHPAPTGLIYRGHVHPKATPRGPVHPPPPGTVHPNPPQRSLFIQRQNRSALVSSSSEGTARSGSVNSHRSITRVQ